MSQDNPKNNTLVSQDNPKQYLDVTELLHVAEEHRVDILHIDHCFFNHQL